MPRHAFSPCTTLHTQKVGWNWWRSAAQAEDSNHSPVKAATEVAKWGATRKPVAFSNIFFLSVSQATQVHASNRSLHVFPTASSSIYQIISISRF